MGAFPVSLLAAAAAALAVLDAAAALAVLDAAVAPADTDAIQMLLLVGI
jgi:hypothetical protein